MFLIPKGASFQGPNAQGADSVHGFLVFMENAVIANKYPKWWLKTLPVKSFKLACEGWARSMAGLRDLVQEAMRSYSASADVEEHTFLEQWAEQGMNENEIVFNIGGTMVAATDTVSQESLHGYMQLAVISCFWALLYTTALETYCGVSFRSHYTCVCIDILSLSCWGV